MLRPGLGTQVPFLWRFKCWFGCMSAGFALLSAGLRTQVTILPPGRRRKETVLKYSSQFLGAALGAVL